MRRFLLNNLTVTKREHPARARVALWEPKRGQFGETWKRLRVLPTSWILGDL